MVKFLIDANLPKRFKIWSGDNFLHVFDLNDEWTDSEIWNYAKEHDFSILTKDADFSVRILSTEPPPKIIHFRTGNMKMNEFHSYVEKNWNEIASMNESHKLVNVYNHKITAIA